MMKALSVRQPHVAAMFARLKRYEIRSWPTHHRGALAIHASRALDVASLRRMDLVPESWGRRFPRLDQRGLQLGAVVGIVDVVDCIRTEDVPRDEREWGVFPPEHFAWVLSNPRLLRAPVPIIGRVSLWNWQPGSALAGVAL